MDKDYVEIHEFGFQMNLDPNEYIDNAILRRTFEPVTTKWISSLLNPGDTFIDVGANIGYFTLIGATRVGGRGKVLSFEPTTFAMGKLQENIAINNLSNVMFFKYALADKKRHAVDISFDIKEYINETDASIRSSWLKQGDAVGSAQIGNKDFCDFIRLDDLLESIEINGVDMIKIDVDGNELSVLSGAINTIERFRPILILELIDPGRSPKRYEGPGLEDLQKHLRRLFGTGYTAESEKGDRLTTADEMLAYLSAYDGRSGAPNFLFSLRKEG